MLHYKCFKEEDVEYSLKNLDVGTQSQIPLDAFELHFVKVKHKVFVWGFLGVYLLILHQECNLF